MTSASYISAMAGKSSSLKRTRARAAAFLSVLSLGQATVQVTVDTSVVTNPSVNKRWLGCHHDYGESF